jgi:hypothetical protein
MTSMSDWQDKLLAAWDARDKDNKFQIVCMVHNQRDQRWHYNIGPWARRNAIRILTLGEQCVSIFGILSIA